MWPCARDRRGKIRVQVKVTSENTCVSAVSPD